MPVSDIEQAARASRARSFLMATMAVVLIVNAFIGINETSSSDPLLRHGLWALMVVLWLVILATGGWLQMRKSVRRLMNDEVALANRSQALQAGFWVAILAGLALYFASLRWEMGLRDGLRFLVDFSIAAALVRYAWLELR